MVYVDLVFMILQRYPFGCAYIPSKIDSH